MLYATSTDGTVRDPLSAVPLFVSPARKISRDAHSPASRWEGTIGVRRDADSRRSPALRNTASSYAETRRYGDGLLRQAIGVLYGLVSSLTHAGHETETGDG